LRRPFYFIDRHRSHRKRAQSSQITAHCALIRDIRVTTWVPEPLLFSPPRALAQSTIWSSNSSLTMRSPFWVLVFLLVLSPTLHDFAYGQQDTTGEMDSLRFASKIQQKNTPWVDRLQAFYRKLEEPMFGALSCSDRGKLLPDCTQCTPPLSHSSINHLVFQ
jgi:hypothetical protein